MIQETTLVFNSFNEQSLRLKRLPGVYQLMYQGDKCVYPTLLPLTEDAFDYRDSIDVTNHVSGLGAFRYFSQPTEGLVLYLASSYGQGPNILKGFGFNVVSADINRKALAFAGTVPAMRVCADAVSLPFSDNSFGAVVSRDFVAQDYHLLLDEEKEIIIDEIHRVLRPGGKAVFYTLYYPERVNLVEKSVEDGLPDIRHLENRFQSIEKVNVKYNKQPDRDSIVLVAKK